MGMLSNREFPVRRLVQLTLLVWLAMIGFDFFLHAGLLAEFYTEPSSFLLPPDRSFARIPVGYLSFLLIAFLLIWLMAGLGIQGWRQGALFGLKLGALVSGAFTLGLFSISTVPAVLLGGWFFGQIIELVIAGMFAGSGLAGSRPGPLFLKVAMLLAGALILTAIMQNTGLAPALRR